MTRLAVRYICMKWSLGLGFLGLMENIYRNIGFRVEVLRSWLRAELSSAHLYIVYL